MVDKEEKALPLKTDEVLFETLNRVSKLDLTDVEEEEVKGILKDIMLKEMEKIYSNKEKEEITEFVEITSHIDEAYREASKEFFGGTVGEITNPLYPDLALSMPKRWREIIPKTIKIASTHLLVVLVSLYGLYMGFNLGSLSLGAISLFTIGVSIYHLWR